MIRCNGRSMTGKQPLPRAKEKGAVSNALHESPERKTGIKCSVENCTYNSHYYCTADAVDIAGAKAAGLDTLYMHTELTPPHQKDAVPALLPGAAPAGTRHFEFEGDAVDYLGNPFHYSEMSCVAIVNSDYSLSRSQKYIDYLEGLMEYEECI